VRSEVLEKHPKASLRVYVVWFDMMRGDSRQLTDLSLLSDARVTNYWDARQVAGSWFAQKVDGYDGVAWDEYWLYGRDATWVEQPKPLLSNGSSVIGSSDQLDKALRPLLA
jgi:hypothetical protein